MKTKTNGKATTVKQEIKAAAAAQAKDQANKKANTKAPKQQRTYRAPDTKFKVNPDYQTREGTVVAKMVDAANKLKTFTRDELVAKIAVKGALGNEKRARGFVAWSLGHNVFVDAN